MRKPNFSGPNSRVPVTLTDGAQGTRVVGHIDLSSRLYEIFDAFLDEGFDGVNVEFSFEAGLTWSIDLDTPAGAVLEWLCRYAMLGYQLPDPESAVAYLRKIRWTQGGGA